MYVLPIEAFADTVISVQTGRNKKRHLACKDLLPCLALKQGLAEHLGASL